MATHYGDIWENRVSADRVSEIQERTGYSEREITQTHVELFERYMEGERDRDKDLEFDRYVNVMVNGHGNMKEYIQNHLNIDPADFDWQAWREAMGY